MRVAVVAGDVEDPEMGRGGEVEGKKTNPAHPYIPTPPPGQETFSRMKIFTSQINVECTTKLLQLKTCNARGENDLRVHMRSWSVSRVISAQIKSIGNQSLRHAHRLMCACM